MNNHTNRIWTPYHFINPQFEEKSQVDEYTEEFIGMKNFSDLNHATISVHRMDVMKVRLMKGN